jgi:hypothetical protein
MNVRSSSTQKGTITLVARPLGAELPWGNANARLTFVMFRYTRLVEEMKAVFQYVYVLLCY